MQSVPASVIAACVLCATLGFGQSAKPDSNTYDSGRMWARLAQPQKTGYILGFLHAASLWASENQKHSLDPSGSLVSKFPSTSTVGEIIESVDHFYREPTNRCVPVFMVLTWVQRKEHGDSDAKLREYELSLRSGCPR
jgi:hypothetical protein